MQPLPAIPGKIRFGVFEADPAVGELRKRDKKVPLENQPFQLLTLLLRRPGEVVTREELQKALWPSGTFVEFEHGVNTAINKIRRALGDTADNPRFIETLPRKGYRFIAPVLGVEPPAPVPLPPPRRRWHLFWVLAGTVLVSLAGGMVFWSLRKPTGVPETELSPVPLTSYPGEEAFPSFSPDGTQVAFQWCPEGKPCQIYVKQIGVEPPVQLTDGPATNWSPAWSPDGQMIAFLRLFSLSRLALILVPQRGGAERIIAEFDVSRTGDLPAKPYLAWSPDSKWLVTPALEGQQAVWSLFLVAADTGEKRRLTSPPTTYAIGDTNPAFSSDGRTLAFNRRRYGRSDLYLLHLTGGYAPQGEPQWLTSGTPYIYGIDWAPGNREIVFSSGRFGYEGLSRIAVSQYAKARPLAINEHAWAPAVSRKANRLTFMVSRADSNLWRLDVSDLDRESHNPEKFIASTRWERMPSYSRDGTRIAYLSNQSGAMELWMSESDGSRPVKLTSFRAPMIAPNWSPNGQSIAVTVLLDGNRDIYVISVNGGVPRRLTDDRASDRWPYWSHDGRWLYFTSRRTGQDQIWKMPSSGGRAIQITRNGGDVPEESPDGKMIYYLKGWPAECSLWKVPVGGGEEMKVLDGLHREGQSALWNDGIYFFTAPDKQGRTDLCLHQFADGKTRKLMTTRRPLDNKITASPDGRTILYPQVDEQGSDLMLVENFH